MGLPTSVTVPGGGFVLVDVVVGLGMSPKNIFHSLKAARAALPSESPIFKSHKPKVYTVRKDFRIAEQGTILAHLNDFLVDPSTLNYTGSLWSLRHQDQLCN